MLYLLLLIIAIGVLLASEAGQEFGKLLIKLAIIGGLLYFGFWIVVIVIAFFTSDTGKSFISEVSQLIVGIFILAVLYYGGNYLSKILKDKEKRVEIWKNVKGAPIKIIRHWWKTSKITFFAVCFLILFILIPLIMNLFL